MRESDFHQVPDKPQAVSKVQDTESKIASEQKPQPVPAKKEEDQPSSQPTLSTIKLKESKSTEKKLIRLVGKQSDPTPDVVLIEPSPRETRESREPKHERSQSSERHSSSSNVSSNKHSSKDLKRAEKAREKERDEELRKREKDRRKNKRTSSPATYESNYYRNSGDPDVAIYEDRVERSGRDRERNERNERTERDLSSVSNSSQGSIPPRARSMEPPEIIPELRESKRRKIEVVSAKKSSSQGSVIQIPEGNGKREKAAKTAKKDKSDEAKELRREKKRSRKDDVVVVSEKRSRKDDESKSQHKNGAEQSPSRGSKHRYETSPEYEHETRSSEKMYKSRTRSGY